MLRRILFGLLFAIAGYLVGAFGGGYLVHLFSSNQHDREMEAAMTGAFVFGPALAAVAFLVGVMVTKPRSKA
jgi:Na+/proline symporter